MTDEEFTRQLLNAHADTQGVEKDSDEQEVLALKLALDSYRRETLHWAERKSAVQPSLAARARAERWKALPQWALATIAFVTIAGGVMHLTNSHADYSTAAAGSHLATVTTSATAAEIAEDNRLLSSIDAELSYHGASSIDALRLRDESVEGRATSGGALN